MYHNSNNQTLKTVGLYESFLALCPNNYWTFLKSLFTLKTNLCYFDLKKEQTKNKTCETLHKST